MCQHPQYLKDYRILVFISLNSAIHCMSKQKVPVPLDLDNLFSFILFYEFLYFPLKINHAMHSVAIWSKIMLIVSILRVNRKLL